MRANAVLNKKAEATMQKAEEGRTRVLRTAFCRLLTYSAFSMFFLSLAGADKPADKPKPQRVEISITGLQYKPATMKIKAGDTVVWTNNDDRDHTVVSSAPKNDPFKSENLKTGQTFEHTFPKAGKFTYGCSYHPRMKGEIVVE